MTAAEEIDHALDLIREVMSDGDATGLFTVIPIDADCRFGSVLGHRCGRPLTHAIVIPGSATASVAAYCTHHSAIMIAACERWRALQ